MLAGCLRYLDRQGIFHWRNSTGVTRIAPNRWISFGKKGSSDILAILPPNGRLLCIECKAQNGRLSSDQKEFLATISHLGGLSIVAKSWQELDQALRDSGYIADPLFEYNSYKQKEVLI